MKSLNKASQPVTRDSMETGSWGNSFIPCPCVRNDRKGARLPELRMKEEEPRHQKAVSTMTFLRAEWVLIR